MLPRRERERLLARRGEVDVVVRARGGWSPSARRICGSSSTTRIRVTRPTLSRTTIVSPPPGVSSTSMSPPIASTKPLRDREPEADAVVVAASRRAAGTAGTSRCRRRAARRRHGRRRGGRRRRRTRPASRRTGSRQASAGRALPTMFASARSRRPASARTRGSDSGTSTLDAVRASAEAPERGRDDLVEPDRRPCGPPRPRPAAGSCRAGFRPAPLRRSTSSSIVSRNSLRASSVQLDVVLEQAGDRGLDRRDRRAEVVRDSREDRRAQLVRPRRAKLAVDASAASSSTLERGRDLAPRTPRGSAGPRSRDPRRPGPGRARRPARSVNPAASGSSGARNARSALDQPAPLADGGARTRPGARASDAARRAAAGTVDEPGRGETSACASARARAPSTARRAASETSRLTTTATARKTSSARTFSVSPIVNV